MNYSKTDKVLPYTRGLVYERSEYTDEFGSSFVYLLIRAGSKDKVSDPEYPVITGDIGDILNDVGMRLSK